MEKKYRNVIIAALSVFVLSCFAAIALILRPELAVKTEVTTETAPEWTVQIQYDDETTAAKTAAPVSDTMTISFVGDCMFASNHGAFGKGGFNNLAQTVAPTYFLQNFIPMFTSDDFTIANCEGVLSDREDLVEKSVTTEIAFWFKGPTRHAQIFKQSGIELASVVNNHSHDFGQQGSDDTVAALENAGILPGKRDVPTYTTVKGQKIGIFCCSLYGYDYMYDIRSMVYKMKSQNCDLIILYFHGGIENETVPETWKVRACHDLIDAGADIIVGSHPHVLQPMEIYKGKPIIYSLGNFCFGGNVHPPRNTAVYQAVFSLQDGKITTRQDVIIPCQVYAGKDNNYQPFIVTDEAKKQEILRFMHASEE